MRDSRGPSDRSGAIVAVIIVTIILGTLAASALTMSSGYKRRAGHAGSRFAAQVAAKASAEEAALLIHNGKLDVVIDEALTSQQPQDMSQYLTDRVYDNATQINGVVGGRPKVTVTAAVANPDGWAQTPEEQWQAIMKEVTDARNTEAINFWQEMKDKNLIGTAPPTSNAFMDMCEKISIDKIVAHHSQNPVPNTTPEAFQDCKCLDGAHDLASLFGTVNTNPTNNKVSFSYSGGGPDPARFKQAWDVVLKSVAKDAASKVESCGSNPAGAMAHLVGDLYHNEVVSSGTERSSAKAFLESGDVGVTSTYLLEICAEVGYGAGADGTERSGKANFTTYRLFQKAPWEKGITAMQTSLVKCMLSGCGGKHRAYTRRDIEQIWPAQPADPSNPVTSARRRCAVPTKTDDASIADADTTDRFYDPQAVIGQTVFETLPASVGSRLFPYTLCSSGGRQP